LGGVGLIIRRRRDTSISNPGIHRHI